MNNGDAAAIAARFTEEGGSGDEHRTDFTVGKPSENIMRIYSWLVVVLA
jgi:hypothetical protein